MVAVLGYSKEEIRQAVTEMYTVVANQPSAPLHFPIGKDACRLAGYDEAHIEELPPAVVESFAGVGNPFRAGVVGPGDTVLDVGSGSGTDVLLASRLVGDSGKVHALDLTPAMRDKLVTTLQENHISNVEIHEGEAEQIPLPNASVDVVTSNGVLNLVADKRRAIAEMFRVLKPGGYAQIADIVIASPVTPDCEDDPRLWAECVVGATVDETYLEMFADAGFEHIEVLRDYDYFSHSPSEETKDVARQFGAHAYELKMTRGDAAPAKIIQWTKRLDPRRLAKAIQRRGLWGTAAFIAAIVACYGTLVLVGALSLIGVSLAINNGVWAGAIISFVILALGVIGSGYAKHRSIRPLLLALTGAGLLIYTLLFNYNAVIEFLGFAVLALGTWLDYSRRRWAKVPGGRKAGMRNRKQRSTREWAST